MSTVVMHAVTSLDGHIADENDDVGPLFDWYFNGEHPLVDEVATDVVPVVFGAGEPCFGRSVTRHQLDDPHVVIQGDRVLHLRCRVGR